MLIVYATIDTRKMGRLGASSCPLCPDCYLCDFEKCRRYIGTAETRFEVHTMEQLERIAKKMRISHIIDGG